MAQDKDPNHDPNTLMTEEEMLEKHFDFSDEIEEGTEDEIQNADEDTEGETPEADDNQEEETAVGVNYDELPFQHTLDQLGLTVDWARPITHEDIAILCEQRPFLQITTADGGVEAYDTPIIQYAETGWVIVNYGDAICSAPGEYLFNYGGMPQRAHNNDDEGEGDPKLIGTLRGQTFLTTSEIIDLAKSQGWHNIHVIDGMPNMIWALWAQSERKGVFVSNYTATKVDKQMRERLYRSELEDQRHSARIKG